MFFKKHSPTLRISNKTWLRTFPLASSGWIPFEQRLIRRWCIQKSQGQPPFGCDRNLVNTGLNMAKLPTSTGFHAGISEPSLTTTTSTYNKHRRKPFPIDAAGNMVIEPPTATNNKAQRNKSKPPSAASHWESLSQRFGSGEKYHKLELVFLMFFCCIYDICLFLLMFQLFNG